MSVSIFFCYAHEDEALLKQLKAHLTPLLRQKLIDLWHDRDISAGSEWEQEISQHLNAAQIILLLVSPDFMASDYCYSIEMKRALERHQRGEARVIPIILRPVYWKGILGTLQALPTDAKPVKSWSDVDAALFDVTEGICTVVEQLEEVRLAEQARLAAQERRAEEERARQAEEEKLRQAEEAERLRRAEEEQLRLAEEGQHKVNVGTQQVVLTSQPAQSTVPSVPKPQPFRESPSPAQPLPSLKPEVISLLRTLTGGHASWVYSVAFSPDGQTLASGSNDTTIKLWGGK